MQRGISKVADGRFFSGKTVKFRCKVIRDVNVDRPGTRNLATDK
jgi:hypothetical protein